MTAHILKKISFTNGEEKRLTCVIVMGSDGMAAPSTVHSSDEFFLPAKMFISGFRILRVYKTSDPTCIGYVNPKPNSAFQIPLVTAILDECCNFSLRHIYLKTVHQYQMLRDNFMQLGDLLFEFRVREAFYYTSL